MDEVSNVIDNIQRDSKKVVRKELKQSWGQLGSVVDSSKYGRGDAERGLGKAN